MKNKSYCFACEAQGLRVAADTEVYIDAIGEIAPVCHKCLRELIEENTLLDEVDDDFEEDKYLYDR
jgi:hypothetical protein